MKAEHRKELETNVLADRVGRVIQSMKQRPQKRTMLWVLLGIVVFILVFYFLRRSQISGGETSLRWMLFAQGDFRPFKDGQIDSEEYRRMFGNTKATPAAQFNGAWVLLWDFGIKELGTRPEQALRIMKRAEIDYQNLLVENKGDPVWEPEALYALAVIEETRAIRDRNKYLPSALDRYKEVLKDHKDSAFGKLAAQRIEFIENNREEVEKFYRDLQNLLKVKDVEDRLENLK